MSPQTILIASSTSGSTTTSNQNASSGTVSSAVSTAPLSSSASLNAAIRSSNLPASLTITPTNGSGNSMGANRAKLPPKQIAKSSITANTNRCSNLPTLQWPWSTSNTTSSTIPPPSSSSSLTPSSSSSLPSATTCTNTQLTPTAASNANCATLVSNQAKKRIAPHVNSAITDNSTAKKSRSNINMQFPDGHHITNAAGSKRLKAAALEESQTKITGYFKSQMKAQMHASNSKLVSTINSVASGNLLTTTTSPSVNSMSNAMTSNALTMSAPATTASLNKYFNILAQLKENSKPTSNLGTNNKAPDTVIPLATTPASTNITQTQTQTLTTSTAVSTMGMNLTPPSVTITTTKPQNLTIQPVTMPALKKIERPKPTKIAQVAPNLRKTPSSSCTYSNLSTGTGKSPAKKHVAIAPRTPEMKQQQQQQQQNQIISNKQENIKAAATGPHTTTSSSTQQPAVLLTAIRLPSGQQQTTPTKQSITSNKLTQATNVGPANTSNAIVGPTVPNAVSSAPATATTLYQLPAVQLPSLVQLPHLLAANGANLMQLNNIASMAKTAVSSTATSTTAATSATSAQAAQAAAAQYFLNGTVFKLQQFTTATTTTSTAASGGNGNPFNLLSASDLNDMLIKQQQQQQQLQQMQQQQKAAVANATATSFQEIFQQQIAAAIAANQQQQQQAQLQQLQRLGAAANIQQQPVFMATPAGLLLNAASLPAMLAQAAAALAVNTQQQQQQQQKAIALPALQPIQQTPLPALSSIFAPPAHQQTNDQHDIHHQQQQQLAAHLALAQQQFLAASQPPPLSSVTIPANNASNLTHNNTNGTNINSNNVSISNSLNTQTPLPIAAATQNNTAKLAIVKATAAPPAFTTLSSQPPPLVTISNAKSRPNLMTTVSGAAVSQKPSVLNKPYQKRSPKVAPIQGKAAITVPNPAKKTNAGKITTSTGKIIASSTTPPPLVPTLTPCAQAPPIALSSAPAAGVRVATVTNQTKASPQLPTPALVSIAPTNTTPIAPKPAQSQSITCGNVTITPTSTGGKSLVNIAPKISPAVANNPVYKFNGKPTPTGNTTPTTSKAKAKTSTSELFDLVKNSNGAISITPAPAATVTAFNNTNNFSAPLNFCASTANFKPTMPLEEFSKIKDEPIDDIPIPMISTISDAVSESTTEPKALTREDKLEIKDEPPTSFSGQIPSNNADVKEEITNSATEDEDSEKSCSSQANILMNNDCSSSSFSCHSNSVSSAADLSLEASTPASITSSSEAPSPGCSMLSPLNTSCNQFATPNPCLGSNSVGYSNSSNSNSCETAGGASSRDMLSEMVTSTCISSDSSESSSSVSLPDNEECKQSVSEVDTKSIDENGKQRDLPTPESGIGGSLSNTESMDSSKSSNSETSSSAASSTCEQEVRSSTSDSQTPPATPLALDSSGSMDETQNESLTQSNSFSEYTTSATSLDMLTPTIDTKLAEVSSETLPKCAISPILSQPKTIRFPANKGNKRHDGICYWDKCNKKHDSNSKLLDHMQQQHVNSQSGPFSCLWVGCKVYNKESCSRRWLERHVLSHGGSKQFKCIVEGCGLRFGSQLALQKHVNNHFSGSESRESTNKRTSDPPVPKQLRKNGKKLRYRRQPFSARMFDFFDAGIMEGLQHRLRQISTLTNGCNSITFKGQCIMKRKTGEGKTQCYVQWSPRDIISDEWIADSEEPFLKTINIKQMKPTEKNKVESLLMTAYKLPYSPTIFENDYALSRQSQAGEKNTNDGEDVVNGNEEDEEDDEDEDEDEDDAATTSAETISSYQNVLSITNIQMQQRRKHPRKQQCRVLVTR